MPTPSRNLKIGLGILAVLLLGLTGSESESVKTVLAVGAGLALLAVIPFLIAWWRAWNAEQGGPETLTTPQDIKARLEQLREGASAVSAIWSGEYDAAEVGSYFEVERRALKTNPNLHISRVINPAVIPDQHFDLLQSIREKYSSRFVLLEDSTLRSFELYIAEYPNESSKDAVAVVVINNTFTKRPQVALVLDPAADKGLAGAVDGVRGWWNAISEGLPAFDPIAIERWDHIASRYTRLVTLNANKIEFLDQYAERERQAVGEYLQSIADQGHELSVVEIGCGDGRALLSYVPTELARSTTYVLGIDYAPAMIAAANRELDHLRAIKDRMRPDARVLVDRTAFFQLNAANMRRHFDDGRLHELEQLLGAGSGSQLQLDTSNYGASRKVICCLLNTIGVMEPYDRRVSMLESMLSCLGVEDNLIFTVFAAERFADEAKNLYRDLQEMIDAEVDETQFDITNAIFSVGGSPGYYSHWFTEPELHQLINAAKAPLEREGRSFRPVHIQSMGSGGYFAAVRRTG